MADVSIPKQLTGPEVLESILFELRQKLRMNGRFSSHMAYPGYQAEVSLKFYPAASFVPGFEQVVELKTENPPPPGGYVLFSEAATVEELIKIPIRPPNQVREDSGMPTPILTQDEHGNMVEKWVNRKVNGPKNKKRAEHLGPEPAVTMVPTAVPVGVGEV